MNDDAHRVKSLDALRSCMVQLPPGKLGEEPHEKVESLLMNAWEYLAGSGCGGMEFSKLNGRTEELAWNPPHLTFSIERHGAIVAGSSSRAEMQCWSVNVETAEAAIVRSTHRQVYSMDDRLDVKAIASKISKSINTLKRSPHLRWNDAKNEVRIIGLEELVPGNNKQTIAGRRKRFRVAIETALATYGWVRVNGRAPYTYAKS